MKVGLYLMLLLGILCTAIGLLMILAYGLIIYISPVFKDAFNLSFHSSRWFFFVVVLTICSGICISFYSLAKANDDNYMIFLSFALISNGFSLFAQIFRMIVHGFAWMGVELLGKTGDVRPIQYLSIGFLAFTLVSFVLCLSVLREERLSH
ncbi:MAG TPA: hypothetical protein PLP64_07910 [Pseudothermotoga sp.]|nr:hypothetical protein [Pseudothermotoga sp.]HOK84134.1 hypothetical protein [Pseudothermotoga sp.]HPP69133.1 hypothetical protein [Pseudothermotoga sp.]